MKIEINRRMLVYKAWYFFAISAISITPFLSLYFKQLGMSPSRIGVATFVKYILAAIFTPIVGFLADKYRCPKLIVIFLGIVWIGSTVLMGFTIPLPRERTCERIHEYHNHSGEQIDRCISQNNGRQKFSDEYQGEHDDDITECELLNATLAADRTWLFTPESVQKVFYLILISNSLLEMTFEPLQSIADAESVNTLEDMGIDIADYGKQRAFGSLGWGIAPVIFGAWITSTRTCVDKCGVSLIEADYSAMFYIFILMSVATMVTMVFFSYSYDSESKDNIGFGKQFVAPLCNLRNLTVLFVLTFTGLCDGTVIGYVYWHVDNIGGNELIMGLASSCHSVSEVILGFATGALIRRFGHFPLITVGIMTYLLRFIYYAYITNPWWIIGSEILNSLTFILTWNATLSYLSVVVPCDFRTSLASLLNALVNGLGTAFGYLLGGYLIEMYGPVAAFKIYAIMCGVVALLFIGVSLSTTSGINEAENDNRTISYDTAPLCPGEFKDEYPQPLTEE